MSRWSNYTRSATDEGSQIQRQSIFEDDNDAGFFNEVEVDDHDDRDDRGRDASRDRESGGGDADDIDPLDAFMMGVEKQLEEDSARPVERSALKVVYSDSDDDGFVEDDAPGGEQCEEQGGSDDKKGSERLSVEPLAPIDHSSITYKEFKKSIYQPPIVGSAEYLSSDEIEEYRRSYAIVVAGAGVSELGLMRCFSRSVFDGLIVSEIEKAGFTSPTPIQSQAIPLIMSGRDVIGLAKTGSGKTMAYMLPLISHVLMQESPATGEGPVGLVLVPTRELAVQIYNESKRFCKAVHVDVCPIYGGVGRWEMVKALKEGPEIVIATPGRLIDLIRDKATNLQRCTFFVLDEADRMFEMGFEYQMRSIAGHIRPDRQTIMFSATMRRKVEGFAREILTSPIRISVGAIGQANSDIHQIASVFKSDDDKLKWLSENLDEFISNGKVLIFVNSKADTEAIMMYLRDLFMKRQLVVGIECIHGDKDQNDRAKTIRQFSKANSEVCVLVATDVASRGLDIKDVNTVINYEIPKNIETYIHRIGRTGRLGINGVTPGVAHTLLTSENAAFAVDLVRILEHSDQLITPELHTLAQQSIKYRRGTNNSSSNKDIRNNIGGNFSNNSSSHSNTGRVGLGISGIRAMTSELLANQTGLQKRSLPPPPPQLLPQQSSYSASSSAIVSGPVLKGFVRASNTIVTSTVEAGEHSTAKRSRWDR